MKRFITNIIIYFLVLLSTFALIMIFDITVIGDQNLFLYNAAIIDKINRLKSIDEAKIILVGNSNVAFGINSEMIEDYFHMPVVNLGLHGGLGNAFHENMAKYNIKKGDIVILSHVNYGDDDKISEPILFWTTVETHTYLYNLIRLKDLPSLLKAYPKYFVNSLLSWKSQTGNFDEGGTYSRTAFNSYGDLQRKEEADQCTPDELFYEGCALAVPDISDACINRINRFYRYVESKGATLLVASWPIGKGDYTPEESEYDEFEEELKEKLDCEVISHFTDYFIPYEYFFDTIWHLNNAGAEIRTSILINDLAKWMRKRTIGE